MFFVGIDVAKRSHQAAVTDISGNIVVKPFNFRNSSDGFATLWWGFLRNSR